MIKTISEREAIITQVNAALDAIAVHEGYKFNVGINAIQLEIKFTLQYNHEGGVSGLTVRMPLNG